MNIFQVEFCNPGSPNCGISDRGDVSEKMIINSKRNNNKNQRMQQVSGNATEQGKEPEPDLVIITFILLSSYASVNCWELPKNYSFVFCLSFSLSPVTWLPAMVG